MIQKLSQKVRQADLFGAAFQPKIKYSRKEYKTAFGGVMSILLYGLSLGYLTYSFTQWVQGQLLPKITSIQTSADSQSITFDGAVLKLSLRQSSNINPVDPQALILIPLVIPYVDSDVVLNWQYFNTDQIVLNGSSVTIQNISLQYGTGMKEIEQIIVLAECNTAIIPSSFRCANESMKSEFFQQRRNILVIDNYVNQFNTHKRTIETVGKEQIVALLDNTTYFQTTNYNIQETAVDVGFLFQNLINYEYATDFYTTSQQLDQVYFRKQFQQNAVVALKLRIGKIRYFQSIQYSKISEVLADVGSIASLILLLSYFVIICNQQLQEIESLTEIIKVYYPDYKNFEIKSTIFGNILKVTYQGKDQNIEKFKEYQQKLYQVAEKKLTILNQVYEISRLQFLLLNEPKMRKALEIIHKAGIRIQNFDSEKAEDSINQIMPQAYLNRSSQKLFVLASQSEPTSNQPEPFEDNFMRDEDFDILVMPEK